MDIFTQWFDVGVLRAKGLSLGVGDRIEVGQSVLRVVKPEPNAAGA